MKRRGIVTWFNDIKGFGFIRDNETEEDVYVDYSAVEREGFRTLQPGETVEFRLLQEGGGTKAGDVRVLAPAPSDP